MTEIIESQNSLSRLIENVFQIEDITWGNPKKDFIVRYHGKLQIDSEAAYARLAEELFPQDITPLFRIEDGQQTILLMEGTVHPKPSNPWINLLLFLVTGVCVLFAGAIYDYNGPATNDFMVAAGYTLRHLWRGIPFGFSMLAILLAHEFGHYLAARANHAQVSLPYFIPFPLSPFGTMGAFINLKEPPRNRKALVEIGIAGPLAGFLVAVPVLWMGLNLSLMSTLPVSAAGQSLSMEGNSILYLLMKYLAFGKLLPMPLDFGGLSPMMYWLRYFFSGQPIPFGGMDVHLHPVAWAGWAGLLVTALNLIPAGQLDGGHLIFVLIGKKIRYIYPVILALLVAMGFAWQGWWLWAFLLLIMGRAHAEPLDLITPLDQPRRMLAVIGIVLFVLVFIPVPLVVIGGA